MNRKGQIQFLLNPKTLIYTLGGAFIGFILTQDIKYIILGGIAGFFASFYI